MAAGRMKVLELWRYPVKSLQGERVDEVRITSAGLDGDRRFALFDARSGLGLTARRAPELLFASAAAAEDGGVDITLPDGSVTRDDAVLSDWLGRAVRLQAAGAPDRRRYENPVDFEHEATSPWASFDGAPGPFHDSAAARVSLVSTATIGPWDRRRFRANVFLDGDGEDALVGSTVALGDAVLDIQMRIARCVMTTRPQGGGVERDLDVLRTINRERGRCLAVGAVVARSGVVRLGDALS
ncbi:MOSC domain-containing protein [Microlunatus sp. GCM10028923]|uniref:MOSC domain-containing protein n=1 Tax=Microlunatus sp. GCM10028923 TaxID=3273400 RepID=UPI003620BF05